MTTTDSTLVSLVMQLGRTSASGMDVPEVLNRVCVTLPEAAGVAGAVILLAEPLEPGAPVLFASDAQAGWIGESQRRARNGPLPNALRSGRPLLTPDMTRIGPPEVAAAAAECGLVSSMVLPLDADDDRIAGLQLLGNSWRPVEARHADIVRPLVEVLVARLLDVRTIRVLTDAARPAMPRSSDGPSQPVRVGPADVTTTAFPMSAPGRGAVPEPRRPRHSRS